MWLAKVHRFSWRHFRRLTISEIGLVFVKSCRRIRRASPALFVILICGWCFCARDVSLWNKSHVMSSQADSIMQPWERRAQSVDGISNPPMCAPDSITRSVDRRGGLFRCFHNTHCFISTGIQGIYLDIVALTSWSKVTIYRVWLNPCHFSPQIFTRYGKCYTFNSGNNGQPLLVTMKGGMGNGLELMLDIQQDEYLPVWGETGKLKRDLC